MERIITIMLFLVVSTISVLAQAVNLQNVYIFGVSFSSTDSVAYFTDVQLLDSSFVEKKSHFLYSRSQYSSQLREKMKESGMERNVNLVSFSKKKGKLEKKVSKMKAKFIKQGFVVKYVPADGFKFKSIVYENDETPEDAAKEEKKVTKKEKVKKERPQKGMPPMGAPQGGMPPKR